MAVQFNKTNYANPVSAYMEPMNDVVSFPCKWLIFKPALTRGSSDGSTAPQQSAGKSLLSIRCSLFLQCGHPNRYNHF